ncbi:MAG: epoxyqueuosine reductase, partial [Clostridia bacterium]|nr:epoxyqueuosine reductase [Clostridia bacterium]
DAAAKAGLGLLGKHSLLIHPRYGSYVFLGSILTSIKIPCSVNQALSCLDCGKCAEMCPAMAISERGVDVAKCFSALSQKKKLTDEEMQILRRHHIAWGCDVCQKACPHNTDRKHTDIPFFIEQRHGEFCAQEIEAMSDAEFAQYAFSWRGKNRILQNLQNLADE